MNCLKTAAMGALFRGFQCHLQCLLSEEKKVWSSLWTTLIGNEGLLARSSSVSANPGIVTCPVLGSHGALPVGSLEPEWRVGTLRVFYRLHGRLSWTLTRQVCNLIGRKPQTQL